MLPNMSFGGTPIRTVPEFLMARRTWRERLFSLPWRPWLVHKQVRNPAAPPPGEVWILDGTIICTPSQRAAIISMTETVS